MKNKNYSKLVGIFLILVTIFTTTFATAGHKKHNYARVTYSKKGSSIEIYAPTTDMFRLAIYASRKTFVQEVMVYGGYNVLPALPKGKYSFKLYDSTNEVVKKGKFKVKYPSSKPSKKDSLKYHYRKSDSTQIRAHIKGTHLNENLNLHIHAPATEKFIVTIFDTADVALNTIAVTGGKNLLPQVPVGSYTFILRDTNSIVVETGKFKIKPAHVHAHVKGKYYGDTLIFHVHADTLDSFTLIISDKSETVIETLTVKGGDNLLPTLPHGHYSFVLLDGDSILVEKGKFSVKERPVHSGIHPNPSEPGEGTIFVDAAESENFSLMIYDASSLLIHSAPVKGGITTLPSMTSGVHYYKVISANGHEVSHGRIIIY